MNNNKISLNFTVDDMHKLREMNYDRTKDMTPEKIEEYYHSRGEKAMEKVDLIRRENYSTIG